MAPLLISNSKSLLAAMVHRTGLNRDKASTILVLFSTPLSLPSIYHATDTCIQNLTSHLPPCMPQPFPRRIPRHLYCTAGLPPYPLGKPGPSFHPSPQLPPSSSPSPSAALSARPASSLATYSSLGLPAPGRGSMYTSALTTRRTSVAAPSHPAARTSTSRTCFAYAQGTPSA